ncbi:hypothetical protein Gotri_011007, partial [Gossypium trilobum]|nr:hypothetical protein [Gossypium trilobum]
MPQFLCFIWNIQEKDVPVLIFSAGLADIIEEVLRQKVHRYFKNIKIVSNQMVFDDSGRLVSFKGKLIHSLNKNEHALDIDGAVADNASVKQRTNVLLLGDHTGDLGMSDGLNYENRISVGFLNDNIEKNLESYRKAFDIVYLGENKNANMEVDDVYCRMTDPCGEWWILQLSCVQSLMVNAILLIL